MKNTWKVFLRAQNKDGFTGGEESGIKRGEQLGEQKRAREIVLRMSQRGKSIQDIADDTGLAKENVQHIIQEAEEWDR